jgi:hypothetical protein
MSPAWKPRRASPPSAAARSTRSGSIRPGLIGVFGCTLAAGTLMGLSRARW